MMRSPRVIISAPASGAGKTTVSLGLMAALTARGYKVQPFKVGPDFIDPGYHQLATGNPSSNLDLHMLTEDAIRVVFCERSVNKDVSIIEGVMGMFDGIDGKTSKGSTAHLAYLLRSPVVLVVDAWFSAGSVAAEVLGFKMFDVSVDLAGVILNRVSGRTHALMCKNAIEDSVHVPVLGWLPKLDDIRLPERHLGLVAYTEKLEKARSKITKIGKLVSDSVDLEKFMDIAKRAPPINQAQLTHDSQSGRKENLRLGIAVDEAFSFYYSDSLHILCRLGAELRPFNTLYDKALPEVEGLLLGGGFPEVYALELGRNTAMRSAIRKVITDGMPVLAECGGLMYLTRSIKGTDGSANAMVGVLEADTLMTNKMTLGYTEGAAVRSNLILNSGESYVGHEFHYSTLTGVPADARLTYAFKRGFGIVSGMDGWQVYSTLASYSHTHFYSNPKIARRLIQKCLSYSRI